MTDEQGERVIELLEIIVAQLDAFATSGQSDECPHPEDQRINLSSFGDANHWVCKVCRFDNKAVPVPS